MDALEASKLASKVNPRKAWNYGKLRDSLLLRIKARAVGGAYDYTTNLDFVDNIHLERLIMWLVTDLGYVVDHWEDARKACLVIKVSW